MAPFDPTQIAPDWQNQRQQLLDLYNQKLTNLNAKKGNTFARYGFLNGGNFGNDGKPVDFSNLQVDPNQQHGLYRDELTSEANMLDNADNGPSRGFTGGVANQAARAAKTAVEGRQTGFQQNLQQMLGGFNLEAGNTNFDYVQGTNQVNSNASDYAANQALWQATNDTSSPSVTVPGASGGGSTPIHAVAAVPGSGSFGLSANAVQTAKSWGGYGVTAPRNLKPMTYGGPGNLKPGHGA